MGEGGVLQGLETVGVFVIWTGAMADLPMRCKLYKNPQWTALRACDACGIDGSRVSMSATKFLGCVASCPCTACQRAMHSDAYVHQAGPLLNLPFLTALARTPGT